MGLAAIDKIFDSKSNFLQCTYFYNLVISNYNLLSRKCTISKTSKYQEYI